ncbi:hypothetical protein EMIHUDRAFT_194176 [Emiliania huxleyi CCMP1516]|uniref:NOA1/YqeH-like C-terminal domain-containing protein n=2 Tax=Emiliania huxleyi TaxID=2903 RepID=A0A0D3L125_EMIH1|nr:hypothetical protein EMIHUDRAFT_194176 [Emiliania huxleyi CCMP1516]EOD41710.1 hypothetical protein EMIHUDRAFT_194176 [Emiliania huxleyi CCMP1516]|eukprot:XP_005794139.1 hypothetical protein EMIHUDRAFT_194176 [Emiliania huxleyi CCMP1516]
MRAHRFRLVTSAALAASLEDPRALEAEAARRGQPGAGFEMLGSYGGGPAGRPAGSAPLQAAIEMPRGFCCGCGVRFQANDEAAPGYLPASVLQQRLAPREAVCQRCHSLRYQNRLPSDGLRVGGGVQGADDPDAASHAELRPAHFRALIRSLRSKQCVVVCLVDLFDFHGSLVPELPSIVGEDSPLMLVDLLPKGIHQPAVERWVRAECRRASLPHLHSLDLVSARTGAGMPQLTTSHLPGTTLGFVKTAQLGGRHALYDTPGLVLPNQLTTRLTADELAAVVPKRRGQPVSLRLEEGRSLLLGGLARLDLVAGRPFLFTAYLSDAVTLHPTATAKAAEVRRKHAGGVLTPPASLERLEALGELEAQHELREHELRVEGRGWGEAAVDVVFPGLGWIAVTGSSG